jgi:hypothetical protein
VGLAYGLGLRATRAPRDMCRGIPGHKSLPSPLYVEPPLGERRGLPGLLAHQPRDTRAIHIEVYGAGPDRAEARIESAFRCRGIPGHRLMRGRGLPGPCVRCRYHPGTEDPKTTTIKPPSPLKSPIGGPPVYLRREVLYSSCRGLWGLGLPGKP